MAISSLNDIKKGMVINYEGQPCIVLEARFLRMQQRKPVMQTKLKNIITGKVVEYSFKAGETVTEADVERRKASYLYSENDKLFFMDQTTYDQFFFTKDTVGEHAQLLKEGQSVDVVLFNGNAVTVTLPPKVDLIVTQTTDAVKGNTASGNVSKEATLETGFIIRVPLFIKEGDMIRISTDSFEYVERVS